MLFNTSFVIPMSSLFTIGTVRTYPYIGKSLTNKDEQKSLNFMTHPSASTTALHVHNHDTGRYGGTYQLFTAEGLNYSVRAHRTKIRLRIVCIYYSLRGKGCLNVWGLLSKGVA